jgi:hypothetical protein
MNRALSAFLADADVSTWAGLPALGAAEVADALRVDLGTVRVRHDDRGDPPSSGAWVAAPTRRFAGGLRLWLDDDREAPRVVLIEGVAPRGDDGGALTAPDLGPADELLEAALGPLLLEGGERVYAGRGLAVRLNPENGVLLGLLGFAPTTADAYRTRLRPTPLGERPLLDRREDR